MRLHEADCSLSIRTVKSVLVRRSSTRESYGFTLRYIVVYPPQEECSAVDANCKEEEAPKLPMIREDKQSAVRTTLVSNVQHHGPAFRAGLRNGDRILTVDGVSLNGRPYEEIVQLVHKSGLQLDLMVFSDDGQLSAPTLSSAKLGSLSDDLSSLERNGNTSDGLATPESPSVGSSSPASANRFVSDSYEHLPPASQSERIRALLDRMRLSPAQSQSPLRNSFSYDNVAFGQTTVNRMVPMRIVSSDDIHNPATRRPPDVGGSCSAFGPPTQQWGGRQRPVIKVVPPTAAGLPAIGECVPGQPIHTGVVSQLVQRAASHESDPPSPHSADYEHLAKLRRVSNLTHQFEQGSPVHSVGALKLYYASAYKRELERISSANSSSPSRRVLEKVRQFEQTSPVAPVHLRAPKSPMSPGKRFASSDWDSAICQTPQNGSKLQHRSPSFMNAVSGEKSLFHFRGSTGISPPTSGRRNSQKWKSRRRQQNLVLDPDAGPPGQSGVDDGEQCLSMDTDEPFEQAILTHDRGLPNGRSSGALVVDGTVGVRTESKSNGGLPESRRRRPESYMMATGDVGVDETEGLALSTPSTSAQNLHPPSRRRAPRMQHARIQKFINFFSTSDTYKLENKMQLKKVPDSKMLSIARASVQREGALLHQQVPLGKASGPERAWRQYWVLLVDCSLYLCNEQTVHQSDTNLSIALDSLRLDIRSCIVDIAYDRRQFVFRITTQQHTEHLLQARSADDMLRWIEALQRNGKDQKMDDTNSMALIIKRYEAKSQTVSPSGARKKNGKPDEPPKFETTHSSAQCVQSAPATSRQEASDLTPKSGRKWKKVRKSGSCPVPTPKDGAALGQSLTMCPTSGEDDYVPLLVQLCVKVVEAHGTDTVGVYRIPGNTAAVNALTASLEQGFETVDFSDPRWKDVNVVSSLLKAFLRRLPEPLLTDKLYPFFIDASRIAGHQQRLRKLRTLVRKLPKPNLETLKYLMMHLRLVVSKCHINKMEARNLALMFGPSLVRPSGDSMQTMVTHMSDQCKIVESLILYCDWIFNSDVDEQAPEAITSASADDQMATSFSDMNDLLQRIPRPDEEMEVKSRDNRMMNILNVRRGSKKGERKSSKHPPAPSRRAYTNGGLQRRTQSDKPLQLSSVKVTQVSTVEAAFSGQYQERDIDAEIEARAAAAKTQSTTPPAVQEEEPVEQSPPSVRKNSSPTKSNELQSVVAAMRRQREEEIYSARRVFIAGANAASLADSESDSNLDGMVKHTRHLNLSGASEQALDVLSPETREKIRRLQHEGQLRQLRNKEQHQSAQLRKIQSERVRVEQAYERARDEMDRDEVDDGLSTTSDYSTTSSAALPANNPSAKQLNRSVSSIVSSEIASTSGSPNVEASLRSRPWYDVPEPLSSSGQTLSSTGDDTQLDQNRNLAPKSDARTLTGGEKSRSRISQKIKFRSSSQKQTAASRRNDPRRHTLSDIEQIKQLFRRNSSSSADGDGRAAKTSKTEKLKAWLKWSFRKSSPDIRQNADAVASDALLS